MKSYILAIDQGTTSSRAMLFDCLGNVVDSEQQEFPQYYPDNGWVEHTPEEIIASVLSTCRKLLAKQHIQAGQIKSLGITNQRETTIVWDKTTHKPIYNAIVWQDRRTSSYCQQLVEQGWAETIQQKTGLVIDPYFSATKLKWLLDNVDGARAKAEAGQLAFGTVDSFILWQLTQGKSHYTDATNASRTMLFNIHQQAWDQELLELFDIPASMLPQVLDSAADFGCTSEQHFGFDIPIQGIAGDQQAALFGQACFETGSVKSTYGTGCFVMVNTGDKALKSNNKLLSTVAYRINGQVTYALEGSIFVAGAVIQWLRDGLELISKASDSERLAMEANQDHGLTLIPAFTGLGAPYWDADARGAILGITRDTGIKEIVNAALQSVCFQTKDLLMAMEKDGIDIKSLKVDGGMTNNQWLLQYLANCLQVEVTQPVSAETTALGVAFLAGLQAGVFQSLSHIQSLWQAKAAFSPQISQADANKRYHSWLDAVERIRTEQT
ncbi:glycerol kinase GlpK [Thalassotalea sp. LPB0316]|uniref:glycerol kinase GlpK n=1 Tax=Thalassotalea sp. LPB0316 TaxID=2769490 RepID=UPI001866457B|nr:glycerol kinase GlpK [Thalassotalea sp. LPB0316]QOL25827.1 glycerol kinase GlpK [Thalassotalea sp. LPB0316]